MPITNRPFLSDTDKILMAALAAQSAGETFHVTDLPYRFSSWALDEPENVRLWFEDGQLLAWAVLQTPFWTIDTCCHPELPILYPELLAWADRRANEAAGTDYGRPAWYAMAFARQSARIRDLEAAGFRSQANLGDDSWSKVLLRRPGQLPVGDFNPLPGFVVRLLAGEQEAPAYVELHQAVFESKNMTLPWRLRTLRHPDYQPDLDIVVSAPDGRLAAFCIGWLRRTAGRGLAGQIEPMGSHPDFRGQGLGRAALAEVLRRLSMPGVDEISVETDNYRDAAFGLYESFGFREAENVLVFGKEYGSG